MRSSPTRLTIARATVVLPEPVPPAMPMTKGVTASLERVEHFLGGRGVRAVRLELQVLAERLFHLRDLVQVHGAHAQEVLRLRVIGLRLHDLEEERLRFLELALVVEIDGLVVDDVG